MKLIKQGAEAVLYLEHGRLIKERIAKGYRIREIDDRLRKLRTRSEGRLLMRVENAPKVFLVDETGCRIEMEFIDGKLVKDILNDLNSEERKRICFEMGERIAALHDHTIIHGDLTTSNMLIKDKLYFVDFGLGFISRRVEDKAVDLHLLRQALEGKHYQIAEECFAWVLEGYQKGNKEAGKVLRQLMKVENRGRYKGKNGLSRESTTGKTETL